MNIAEKLGVKIAPKMPLLLDFGAEWCGSCKKLSPVLDEIQEEYKGRLNVMRVDVDEMPDLTAACGIQSLPTLIFYRDESETSRIVGNVSKEKIIKMIDEV